MNSSHVRSERYFYFGISLWFILITFYGFSQSFYINREPDIAMNLIVHGIIFSCWVLLFFVQTSLIATNRIKLHMTLGILGLILVITMIPVGFYTVLYKTSIGKKGIDEAGYNLFTLTVAYIFVFLGLLFRRKPFYHKRFMLFAMVVLTIAAIDRVAYQLDFDHSQLFRKGLVFFPSIALFIFDIIKLRRAILFDLLPVAIILLLFFYSDYFWLSPHGESFMGFLLSLI